MPTAVANIQPRLQVKYRDSIAAQLRQEFGYDNVMQIPSVTKISVNIGLGEAVDNANAVESAMKDLSAITGQRPFIRRSKQAISNFKLRAGMPIGVTVTLRGARMWEFLDRLMSVALPRIRDFRGLSPRQFDGRGNYTFGLTEQVMFPEVDQDKIDRHRGMDVTIVTSAVDDEGGRALLTLLGMPFKEN